MFYYFFSTIKFESFPCDPPPYPSYLFLRIPHPSLCCFFFFSHFVFRLNSLSLSLPDKKKKRKAKKREDAFMKQQQDTARKKLDSTRSVCKTKINNNNKIQNINLKILFFLPVSFSVFFICPYSLPHFFKACIISKISFSSKKKKDQKCAFFFFSGVFLLFFLFLCFIIVQTWPSFSCCFTRLLYKEVVIQPFVFLVDTDF